jgi:hypothetical protein
MTYWAKNLTRLKELIAERSDCECKYCKDYTKKVMAMGKRKAWFSLYEGHLEVIDDRENGSIISFKIKYCPMCGRRLE